MKENDSSSTTKHPDDLRQPQSPLRHYLLDKTYPIPTRKISVDSEVDRSNFCLSYDYSNYTILRVYINTLSEKNIQLYYTKFTPKVKRGQICIIHGYCQCTDDYIQTAEFFAKNDYVVHMLDLRGHGYSGGDRVNEPLYKVLNDIEVLLVNCCERDLSTFILSQGLGSTFVHALLQENRLLPISGVVTISPLMSFTHCSVIKSHWRKLLLKMSPFIFGNLLLSNQINPTGLVKNAHAIKSKIDSVFFQSFITLKMALEYDEIGQKIYHDAEKFSYPILTCYGGRDQIQSFQQVHDYHSRISSEDKLLRIFPQAYHDMHHDDQAVQLREQILNWIEQRRGKVKWKNLQPTNIKKVTKRQSSWRYVFYTISVVLMLMHLFKKFKIINKWRVLIS